VRMSLIVYNGGLLKVNGKLATSQSCCCGGGGGTYASVWKIDPSDGTILETYDTGDDTYGIAFDSNGDVFIVGYRANNYSMWKIDVSESTIGGFYDSGGNLLDIGLDSNDYINFCGEVISTKGVWSITSAKAARWDYAPDSGIFFERLQIDSANDDVYVCGDTADPTASDNFVRFQADGTFEWGADEGVFDIHDFFIGGTYAVYCRGIDPLYSILYKNKSDGTLGYTPADHTSINTMAITFDGTNIFSMSNTNSGGGSYIWKCSTAGTYIAKSDGYTLGWRNSEMDIDMDTSGNAYGVGGHNNTGNYSVFAVDNDCDILWTANTGLDTHRVLVVGGYLWVTGQRVAL